MKKLMVNRRVRQSILHLTPQILRLDSVAAVYDRRMNYEINAMVRSSERGDVGCLSKKLAVSGLGQQGALLEIAKADNSAGFRVTSRGIQDCTFLNERQLKQQQSTEVSAMNQDAKITKKTKARNKAQIRDLKPAKDPKGGIIAILIGMGAKTGDPDEGGQLHKT